LKDHIVLEEMFICSFLSDMAKMAAVGESSVCLPSNTNSEICRKKSVKCQFCDELSTDLYKAQQEILSYEKVIQVVREELTNMDQRTRPVGNSRSELLDDERSSSKPSDGWHQVPFTSRKAKTTKNSSLQIIPPTHNKFELLSNLKEVSDLPSWVN
jgi:hypothetical protein